MTGTGIFRFILADFQRTLLASLSTT